MDGTGWSEATEALCSGCPWQEIHKGFKAALFFSHKVQFACLHEKNYSACKNSCIVSSVVLDELSKNTLLGCIMGNVGFCRVFCAFLGGTKKSGYLHL